MHVLANWIAELVTVASLITQTVIVDLFVHSSGPFCALVDLLYILVDLLAHTSGPFGGLSLTGGGGFFRTQRTPSPLATALKLVLEWDLLIST